MSRSGELSISDSSGRERERHVVVYGAQVKVTDGQPAKPGDLLLEWDPFASPILADQSGRVKFGDLVEGSTVQEQVDEFTGVSSKVVTDSKDPDMRPRVSIKDEAGETIARAFNDLYFLERACQVQVRAMATGRPLRVVGDNLAAATFGGKDGEVERYAQAHFDALKRLLDREDPDYAT